MNDGDSDRTRALNAPDAETEAPEIVLRVSARSDRGLVRANNEDSYCVSNLSLPPQGDEEAMTYWAGTFLVTLCVLTVSHIALAAKRIHDFDRTGWFSLLFIIGDIVAYIALCLPKGTQGPNRYGARTNAPG